MTKKTTEAVLLAAQMMNSGMSVTDTAAKIGIRRETLCKWMQEDNSLQKTKQTGKRSLAEKSRALALMLSGTPITDIAKDLNVNRKTIYFWLREPGFSSAVNDATSAAIFGLSQRLVEMGDQAADVLKTIMGDDTNKALQLKAAGITLERLSTLRVISDLERHISEKNS